MKLDPLQQAITEGNVELVQKLLETNHPLNLDGNGLTPAELANFLGKYSIQKILSARKPKTFKIQLENKEPLLIGRQEFEKLFDVTYSPFLTFLTYEELCKTIQSCPYFFKYQWLFGKNDSLESYYQDELTSGDEEKTVIKWINPEMGYGLFADSNILENDYIGEYAGVVREINKDDPNVNGYCFQYPVKAFSKQFFVIDSSFEGNSQRFINHSDKPNLQPLWLCDKGLMHLVLIAKQDIKKDEELTFNYGPDYWKRRLKV